MYFREESDGSCMEESVMPRLARLPTIPFGWYYVALHSVTGRRIVTSRAELGTVLKLLRVTLRKRGARLHAGHVGEREAHLVLQAGEKSLTAITGTFKHQYARIFNRTHGEHGSLFRLHHHVLLFQHQRWLVPLVHYIHWIRRIEAAEDHEAGFWWSSDAVYLGSRKQGWIATNAVLRMVASGTYNRESQQKAYRELFDRTPAPSHAKLFRHGSAEDPRLLGDAKFVADIWRRTGRRPPNGARHICRREGNIRCVVAQVIEQFNALCEERLPDQAAAWRGLVTCENVRSRSRRRPLPMIRALSAAYLIEHDIATAAQAARFFGGGPTSVSARRRRFYQVRFCEWFGAKPGILFSPKREDDLSARRSNEDHIEDPECAGRSKRAELCDSP
jgi:hypothetical protein